MLLQKINRHKLIILFAFFFLVTRLPGIGHDIVNPDGVNWHWRSEQFVVGLKQLQLERTYQHYQPGVTLMWLVGPTVEIVKQLNGDLLYDMNTFLTFHLISKTVLIFVQLALSIIGIYLLAQIYDEKKAILIFTLLSFEPFFLANSRILHLDVLMTLLLFNGLAASYLAIQKEKVIYAITAGIFLGLATLTKSVALGGILFAAGIGGIYFWKKTNLKKAIKFSVISLIVALATFILFFPALWVNAKEVLFLLYDGIERVGVRKGHNQIFLGEETREAGYLFYPLIFLLKTSPFLVIALAFSAFNLKKFKNINWQAFGTYLTIFMFGYLVVMTISTKKIDRYFIPVYPLLAVYAASINYKKVFWGILYLGFVVSPFVYLYPYHFTYTSPMFGNPQFVHDNILAQKPFGIGIPALKEKLLEDYGYYPSLGFLDIKPMEAIYKNSRVYDFNIDGTRRYDLLILGVNEEIPEKVLESDVKFVYDQSVYINGLEFWKIYVKQN